MAPIKEPHHFCNDIRRKNFTQPHYKKFDIDIKKYLQDRPLKKHHIAYIDQLDQYEALFLDSGNKKYLGESSGGYLYSSTAAQAIYNYNPQAKIIIALREPVDRAYSHWKMNLANGRENEEIPFTQCIDTAYSRQDKGWGVTHLYVDLGLYYEQVQRYLRIFPRQNVLIVFYADLMQSPQAFMDKIFNFLSLDNVVIDESRKSNPSRKPKFPLIQDFVRRRGLARFLGRHVIERVKKLTSTTDFPALSRAEKVEIYEKYFKADILLLQDLIGTDLSRLMVKPLQADEKNDGQLNH